MAFSPGDYSDWSLRGEGGEAEVYRARQVSLDRLVAIKRLKLSSIGDAEDISRFEREAKLCASLIHPNLLPIFDYGSEGKFYYLVMEFVHGVDLGKIADLSAGANRGSNAEGTVNAGGPHRPLPESLKVHLARQMVEVVDFIEQKGILHRDLKPENFMADSTARIKLLDLGMALVGSQVQADPKREVLKGTLAYIPPEMLRGQGHLGKVSEHYSLALVILELFQGCRYYRGKSREEIVDIIQMGINWEEMENVPASVKVFLSPYLNPNPAKRPKNLDALLRGLKGLQGNTLAITGGREAINTVINREQHAWLWAMVHASESQGRFEEAFARIKELLEMEPDNSEALGKFQELSQRMNDFPEQKIPQKPQEKIPQPSLTFTSRKEVKQKRKWVWTSLGLTMMAVMAVMASFYFRKHPRAIDMGRDLMKREMNQLSKEDEAAVSQVGESSLVGSRKPSLRPFGILIVSGLPKDYRLLVNRVSYVAGGEIHLPATRHLLEIQDAKKRSIIRDSITVGGGEPTVFDFQRRAGKQ